MEVIKGIIAKLDVPLAQVLIEAVIIDYALGPNTFNFGVSAAQNPATLGGTSGNNSVVGAGGGNNGATLLHQSGQLDRCRHQWRQQLCQQPGRWS